MRLRDVRIGTQLTIALAVTLVLVVLLGGISWYHSHLLWNNSNAMYQHPFTVRHAVGELRSSIQKIHLDMKDIVIIDDEVTKENILRDMAAAETLADRLFDLLYDRYLGNPADIDSARIAFEQWKVIRHETISILKAGDRQGAARRTMTAGVGGAQAAQLYLHLMKISDYAKYRAQKFHSDSLDLRRTLNIQLGAIVAFMLLLSTVVGLLLLRRINKPLEQLTTAATRFSDGDYEARCNYAAGNEFGEVSQAFNALASNIQNEMHIRDAARHIKHAIITEDTIQPFCRTLLTSLLKRTQAISGAFYLHHKDSQQLHLLTAIGMSGDIHATFSTRKREGVFGLSFETREIVRISDIPEQSYFLHASPLGTLRPREIVSIPIIAGDEVLAMIALGSQAGFTSADLRVLNDLALFLGTRFSSILAADRIQEVSRQMEIQNRELESQAAELSRQTDELSEQNIELGVQKEELNKASAMKSAFLSNMSHELRTPLNSVIALSGVLSRRLLDTIPALEHGYLSTIERNGRHLLAIINDILDLSRIEAGHEEVDIASTNPGAIINDVAEMLNPQAMEKHILLECTLPDNMPNIDTDAGKFRQILINLVGNAIKFTDHGSIILSASVQESTISVSIRDTGVGIASENFDRIFEEFRRIDEAASRKHDGTGLGLAIARRYAELLGGHIHVESARNEGSTFTLVLPRRQIDGDVSVVQPVKPSTAHAPTRRTSAVPPSILVVEDSEAARIQLREILQPEGYRVLFAEDGTQAIQQVREERPDAIILDLMMPEIDGFEVLRVLREEKTEKLLPVLILTAKHVTREELAFLKGNDIHQCIQKGDVNKRELLAAVAAMVRTDADEASIDAPVEAEVARSAAATQQTVLILWDNHDNQDNLASIAALLPECTILQATDGMDGLEAARNHRPDIILLDISLPGQDGVALLEQLKQDMHLRNTPVMALTTSAMQNDEGKALINGFDACVAKPIDGPTFVKTLFSLVHG